MEAERLVQEANLLRRLAAEQIALADELRQMAAAHNLPPPSLDETVVQYCDRLKRLSEGGN